MDDLLNQSCTLYSPASTLDAFGKRTWITPTVVACRFVRITKLYKSNQGNDMNIVCKFQIADIRAVVGTKIDFESKSYRVELIKDWRDDDDYFGCLAYCSDMPV